jgi:hypothetical protein
LDNVFDLAKKVEKQESGSDKDEDQSESEDEDKPSITSIPVAESKLFKSLGN